MSVLWILLLLTGLAFTSLYIARTTSILAHRGLDAAHAEADADAAIIDTISRLYSEGPNLRPPIDGLDQSTVIDKRPVAVRVSRESGRIDINTGNTEIISALLQYSGITESRSKTMIADLRDRTRAADGQHTTLKSIDEITSISSWNLSNVNCILDSLTAYSGMPDVSIVDATQQIQQALQYADDKQLGGHHWVTKSNSSVSIVGERSVFGDVLRIESNAPLSSDFSIRVQWIGRLTGDPKNPIITLFWGKVFRSPSCSSVLKSSKVPVQQDNEGI